MNPTTRTETDLLGAREVPAEAYYGIHTLRARENFALAGHPVRPELIRALAQVKRACALANGALGHLPAEVASAVAEAAAEVASGGFVDQFPVDALQGGAGTSANMNMNEVLANRALERLGRPRGDYAAVDPLDAVNLHQSTNDVFPTAVRVAAIRGVRSLAEALADLQGALQRREKAFARVVKVGRTELQEAVPVTLGAEFSGFAEAVARDRWRTAKCEERLRVVNLGGTAVGTGLAAPRDYIFLVVEKLREETGLPLSRGENLVAETAHGDAFVEVAGILAACAATMLKMSNDLRLLNLLGEIRLPPLQAGSSIMPGKVNPVAFEAASQAALEVFARQRLVADAASRSCGQILEFMPLIADSLLGAIHLLERAAAMLAPHIEGIAADEARCRHHLDRSRSIVTAFLPEIGYARASDLLKAFDEQGGDDLRAFLADRLGADLVDRVLSPERLTALGHR